MKPIEVGGIILGPFLSADFALACTTSEELVTLHPSTDGRFALVTTTERMVALVQLGRETRVLWSREVEFRPNRVVISADGRRVVLFNAPSYGLRDSTGVALLVLDEIGHEIADLLVTEVADLARQEPPFFGARWFGSAGLGSDGKTVEISTVRPRIDLRDCARQTMQNKELDPMKRDEAMDACFASVPYENLRLALEDGQIAGWTGPGRRAWTALDSPVAAVSP